MEGQNLDQMTKVQLMAELKRRNIPGRERARLQGGKKAMIQLLRSHREQQNGDNFNTAMRKKRPFFLKVAERLGVQRGLSRRKTDDMKAHILEELKNKMADKPDGSTLRMTSDELQLFLQLAFQVSNRKNSCCRSHDSVVLV